MSRIVIEIVTPEKQVFFDTVDEVSLPAAKGYLTVLPGHTRRWSRWAPASSSRASMNPPARSGWW